jgi:hypothetical protein
MRSVSETPTAVKAPPVRAKLTRKQRMATFKAKVAIPEECAAKTGGDDCELSELAYRTRAAALKAGKQPLTYAGWKRTIYDGKLASRRERGRIIVSLSEALAAIGLGE